MMMHEGVEKGFFNFEIENLEGVRHPQINFLESFSKNRYCGFMDVSLHLEQPFSVTDGIERRLNPETAKKLGFSGEKILLKMYKVDNKILIPGSSLKGAFRTYFEAVFGYDLAKAIFGNAKTNASMIYFSDILLEAKQILVTYPEQFGKEGGSGRKGGNTIRLYKKKASEEYPKEESKRLYVVTALNEKEEIKTRIIFKSLPKEFLVAFSLFFNSFSIFKQFPVQLKIGRGKNVGMGLIIPKLDDMRYLDLKSNPPEYKEFDMKKVAEELKQKNSEMWEIVSHARKRLEMIMKQTLDGGNGV